MHKLISDAKIYDNSSSQDMKKNKTSDGKEIKNWYLIISILINI
ncbi:MAG: hypothetical protein ACTSO9_12095 [Candidatus Helarchaeota archaeon]